MTTEVALLSCGSADEEEFTAGVKTIVSQPVALYVRLYSASARSRLVQGRASTARD